MVKQSICEKEKSYVEKMNKFQLHHKYKKVGYIISFSAFALMIAKKFVDEPNWVKPVLSGILLVGMLLISLAKEKLEDEYLDSLRSQSYRIALHLPVNQQPWAYACFRNSPYQSFSLHHSGKAM